MSSRSLLAFACVFLSSAFAAAQMPPSWIYSSYFGGNGGDSITAQTHDTSGNIYVAGITTSSNFPTTPGVYEPNYPGPSGYDAIFVSKFSSGGSLLWSTYLGPGCYQYTAPNGIAVDKSGNVYVSGTYECSGFPTTVNLGTSGSVFLSKLNSSGSKLLYSTTLGGNSTLATSPLALDSNANAYIIGSGDYCCTSTTGIIGPLGGISDFWIAKVNSSGTSIPWSVQIGGSDMDLAYGLTLDSTNKLYVTGYSASQDFPTSSGALVQSGTGRAFVMKLDPAKSPDSSIIYSALAGNPGNTANQYLEGDSIAVDAAGNAYIAAWTYNYGLYVSPNAFQRSPGTAPNGYVFELNPSGSAIINGTYLGGGASDYLKSLSLDSMANIYLSGSTFSWDFPTSAYGNMQTNNYSLGFDIKLNQQFAAISAAEFGPLGTESFAATPDSSGGLWFSGYTGAGFPTTPGDYQPNYAGGGSDGFLVHTNFAGLCSTSTVAICTLAQDANNSERIHFASQSANLEGATTISLALDGLQVYSLHAAQFDTWLPVAPGTHTATVTAHALNSAAQQTQQTFTVPSSGTCPLNPINPSLTICSPLNAAVVKGTVNITIEANVAAPPKTISLSIDGKFVAKLSNQNGTYTYTTTLAAGKHTISVTGTDNNRAALSTTAVFQVSQ